MKRLAKLFLWIAKSRYTLEIKNLPKLDLQSNYLILPNHIAYIDPVFIWCLFAPQKKLRAVATSRFSENIFLRFLGEKKARGAFEPHRQNAR